MPANLTPEYRAAEQQFKRASTPDEKLAALRLMLAKIPKHKGTEKLQAGIKSRIARANTEVNRQSKRKGFAVHVEKEGAAQIVIVGPPNAGKSQLVATLTGVEVEVAPYPYTTQRPLPAMMRYEDVPFQLVDLPPVCAVHTESWVSSIVRTADAALLVVDLSSANVLEQTEEVLATLEASKVKLVREGIETDPVASVALKQCRLVGTKSDLAEAAGAREVLEELYGERFGISAVSGGTGESTDELRETVFRMLRLVRVYAKPPHEEVDMTKPFVLREGSTLSAFANLVHYDFAECLKFARLWGHGKFEGQRVNRDYVLSDRDVIELHV